MSNLKTFLIACKLRLIRWGWTFKYRFFREQVPTNTNGKVYINLGCGVNTSSEYINVDAVPHAKTHYVTDISELSMFSSGLADMIYASHVIEHLPRKDLVKVLQEWRRVLKPGGILRFGVPDFDNLLRIYERSGRNIDSIVNQLMGQEGPYDDHHTIWNLAYAEEVFKEAGFSHLRTWNSVTADHHAFHDKTMRVIEVAGEQISISLNLEAVR